MKYSIIRTILLILMVQLAGFRTSCRADADGLVRVQVTALDIQGNPVSGAAFDVYDSAHHQLEDPDEVARYSGSDGTVSYRVPRSKAYYIQVFANSYLPSEIRKVVSTGDGISVTFRLKRVPLPRYPITTIRATIVDTQRHPIAVAFFDISSASGRDTHNLRGSDDLASDPHGHVEKTIRAGGVVHVRVMAGGYDPVEKTVRAKPGVVPVVFVLKRNGEPLPMGAVSP